MKIEKTVFITTWVSSRCQLAIDVISNVLLFCFVVELPLGCRRLNQTTALTEALHN